MRRTVRSTVILLAALCLLCPARRAGAAGQVPFKGTFHGGVAVRVIAFPILGVSVSGGGNATHLGQFTLSEAFLFNALTGIFTGSSTYTAANGDQLFGTTVGALLPDGSFTATTTFTGGTGRFTGASGEVHASGPPSVDGLLTTHIEGSVSSVGSNKK